jgi:hypothetical protein
MAELPDDSLKRRGGDEIEEVDGAILIEGDLKKDHGIGVKVKDGSVFFHEEKACEV